MIDIGLHAEVRRLFYAEHWKVGTIAEQLGLHHDSVERAVGVEFFANKMRQMRPAPLDPYKPFLSETLERYPRLVCTRLHRMAQERGYTGGIRAVRRFARSIRRRSRSEAYLRLRTLPGEQGQVDWGCFGRMKVGRALRPLSCFVMVLSWSRAMFARFFLDQTMDSFLQGHQLAFQSLGGCPRVLLYDNLKSVVLDRVGDHIRFHPRLLELAGHYHFAPQPCAPYRGNEKGKVERLIRFLRESFFAARTYTSLDDLNAQLAHWIETVAHRRPVPGDPDKTIVADALQQEQARLVALPEHPMCCDLTRSVVSGKTPYVRFDGNDYSIPHTLVRKPLTLVASETEVSVMDGADLVARHPRTYDRGRPIEDPRHLSELGDKKRHARSLRTRDRLRCSCPHTDELLDALALMGSSLGWHTRRLHVLLDQYGAADLDAAIAAALQKGAISAEAVAHILDQQARARRRPPALSVVLPDNPRVRDLRVTSHSLGSYDALSQEQDKDDIHV
jgi:transposase